MNRIIQVLALVFLMGLLACDSEEKNKEAAQTQAQAAADEKKQAYRPQADPNPQAIPAPEIDNKPLSKLINDEMLLEVLEIGDLSQIEKREEKNGEFVIIFPSTENPEKKSEFRFSRGETFTGRRDDLRMMAEGPHGMFFDDVGELGGYYEGGETNLFFFPLGGYLYSLKMPASFPDDLKAEKGRILATKIWEENR